MTQLLPDDRTVWIRDHLLAFLVTMSPSIASQFEVACQDGTQKQASAFFSMRSTDPVCTPTDAHVSGCSCSCSFWLETVAPYVTDAWRSLINTDRMLTLDGEPYQIVHARYSIRELNIDAGSVRLSASIKNGTEPVIQLQTTLGLSARLAMGPHPGAPIQVTVTIRDKTTAMIANDPDDKERVVAAFQYMACVTIGYPLPPNILVLYQPGTVSGIHLRPALTVECIEGEFDVCQRSLLAIQGNVPMVVPYANAA